MVPLEGTVGFDCRSTSAPRFHSVRPTGLYVAAQLPLVDIGRELSFTLGDQRYYGEYYNAPLQPGRDYYIILRAVNQWGRVRAAHNSLEKHIIFAAVLNTALLILGYLHINTYQDTLSITNLLCYVICMLIYSL